MVNYKKLDLFLNFSIVLNYVNNILRGFAQLLWSFCWKMCIVVSDVAYPNFIFFSHLAQNNPKNSMYFCSWKKHSLLKIFIRYFTVLLILWLENKLHNYALLNKSKNCIIPYLFFYEIRKMLWHNFCWQLFLKNTLHI